MKQIAVFASGTGTNAENIIKYFNNSAKARVVLVLTNNPRAGVISKARALRVNTIVFNKIQLQDREGVLKTLVDISIDLIVLAGFLLKLPTIVINSFNLKIINIHPSLLPKYGGKGMFGNNVHKAVIANREKESGITIHYVDEQYDNGEIIFQTNCKIEPEDSVNELAKKIHQIEMEHFPKIIEKLVVNGT